MSLHEVRLGLPPIEAATFSRLESNKKLSSELQSEVDQWLKDGGKITEIKSGLIAQTEVITNEFSGENQANTMQNGRKSARAKSVKSSMKSKYTPTEQRSIFWSDADPEKFVVIIGAYISKLFTTMTEAVNHRDFYNRKIGR